MARTAVAAARSFLQRLARIDAARVHRRRESNEDAADNRDGDGEGRDAQVESGLDKGREYHRAPRDQHGDRDASQREASGGAGEGEHAALGDELAEQAAASGAKRGADGNLPAPRLGPREQQVGDVRACDEEHERDRRHQRGQRRAQRTDSSTSSGLASTPRFSLVPGCSRSSWREMSSSSRCAAASVTPGFSFASAANPRNCRGHRRRRRVARKGRPQLRGIGQPFEPLRHHADDGVGARVEPQLAADDLRVAAEAPPPQTVAQHDDWRRLRHIVFRCVECAAALRRDAEQ